MGEAQRQSFNMLSNILATGKSEAIINKDLGEITIDAGHIGKSGFGLKHIIEQRFLKDKASEQDITALLHLVKDAAQSGDVTREISRIKNENTVGSYDISKNGIIAFVSKTRGNTSEKFVITGFSDRGKEKEAADAIQTVIAQYGYTPEFSDVRKQVGAAIASISPTPDKPSGGDKTGIAGASNPPHIWGAPPSTASDLPADTPLSPTNGEMSSGDFSDMRKKYGIKRKK